VGAVFASWDSRRARAYRQRENIAPDLGTAVTVQAMVFGNASDDSGTGVVFTRDPATGAAEPFGEFLPRAQGEDVVSGRSGGFGLTELARRLPAVHARLTGYLGLIEAHHRDMCEVEFTVERGRLWLLQTRIAKRSPLAAVRVAVAMTTDPAIRLTEQEAVARVPADVLARAAAQNAGATAVPPLITGVAGSPGRATGRVVFDPDEAADAGDEVVLVRRETSPEDMHGIAAAAGLLTARGGPTSHAAVVAREWGIPAVVGAAGLEISGGEAVLGGRIRLRAGDVVTIDGGTGGVWLGAVPAGRAGTEAPELAVLRSWRGKHDRTGAQSARSDDRSMPRVTRKSS
jgi:pyruvate,orthophosphate dikinase